MTQEIKVGDTVRRIHVAMSRTRGAVGQEAEVIGLCSGRMLLVKYPGCLSVDDTGGEYWSREYSEKVEKPTFKVGDKLALKETPNKLHAVVVHIDPVARPSNQLIVRRLDDGTVFARHISGVWNGNCRHSLDLVPYVEPQKIEKVTRYVRPIAYGQVRDMLTFNTRSAAEQYVPVLPTDCKYALGEIKEIVLEVEVPSGK